MKTVYLIFLSLLWGMGVQAQDFTLFNVSKQGEQSFDYLKTLQGMEERLHQYGKLFMQTDLKPEIKIWYPELFKWGAFSFPLVTRVPNKAD